MLSILVVDRAGEFRVLNYYKKQKTRRSNLYAPGDLLQNGTSVEVDSCFSEDDIVTITHGNKSVLSPEQFSFERIPLQENGNFTSTPLSHTKRSHNNSQILSLLQQQQYTLNRQQSMIEKLLEKQENCCHHLEHLQSKVQSLEEVAFVQQQQQPRNKKIKVPRSILVSIIS